MSELSEDRSSAGKQNSGSSKGFTVMRGGMADIVELEMGNITGNFLNFAWLVQFRNLSLLVECSPACFTRAGPGTFRLLMHYVNV